VKVGDLKMEGRGNLLQGIIICHIKNNFAVMLYCSCISIPFIRFSTRLKSLIYDCSFNDICSIEQYHSSSPLGLIKFDDTSFWDMTTVHVKGSVEI